MKREIMVSVVVSATGNLCCGYEYDAGLRDVMRALNDAGMPCEASDPGDTEYGYCATEDGHKGLLGAFLKGFTLRRPKRRRASTMAEWAFKRWSDTRSCVWWATCSDTQASGIMPLRKFVDMLRDMGARDDGCGTLGTLGGPLGLGIVADIPYSVESQACIVSLRGTPFIGDANGDKEPRGLSESSWARVRQAIENKL